MSAQNTTERSPRLRRYFRRGVWENIATSIIALGIIMLCQPFLLDLYTYSFVTTLVGTVMFIVVTKFPD
jgi:uncharacterized membrane protein YjjP (DUF1212 family)